MAVLMMFLEDVSEMKRRSIGFKILLMKRLREDVVNFLFTKTDEYEEENFIGSQEILDVLMAFIRGEDADYIGENIFQSDGKQVKEILELLSIR